MRRDALPIDESAKVVLYLLLQSLLIWIALNDTTSDTTSEAELIGRARDTRVTPNKCPKLDTDHVSQSGHRLSYGASLLPRALFHPYNLCYGFIL